jgi:cytoskeletal protein RodZ
MMFIHVITGFDENSVPIAAPLLVTLGVPVIVVVVVAVLALAVSIFALYIRRRLTQSDSYSISPEDVSGDANLRSLHNKNPSSSDHSHANPSGNEGITISSQLDADPSNSHAADRSGLLDITNLSSSDSDDDDDDGSYSGGPRQIRAMKQDARHGDNPSTPLFSN